MNIFEEYLEKIKLILEDLAFTELKLKIGVTIKIEEKRRKKDLFEKNFL